ncbi:MAG: glycogen/starch synthase, partial [Nitrospira sp.]|nr:glycogen/starch synthase [Nitrospira sp.]
MRKKIKILFCSSEVAPFSKTGGLGDVSGSLPKALSSMGCDIRVITPKYAGLSDASYQLSRIIESVEIKIGNRVEEAGLYKGIIPETDSPVYFISNDKYFGRKGLYGEDGEDYEDNLERFSFFSMAVLYFVRRLGWKPDVIHCNDWQTALIPVYLNNFSDEDSLLRDFYAGTGTLFTIHNLGYQGLFSKDLFFMTGLDSSIFTMKGLEYYGKVNLLKGGIVFSDILSAVSPTYSMEIQTEEYGHGLDGVLRDRAKDIYGILNGVDYNEWD